MIKSRTHIDHLGSCDVCEWHSIAPNAAHLARRHAEKTDHRTYVDVMKHTVFDDEAMLKVEDKANTD